MYTTEILHERERELRAAAGAGRGTPARRRSPRIIFRNIVQRTHLGR